MVLAGDPLQYFKTFELERLILKIVIIKLFKINSISDVNI